jgi:hypothetical protein
MSQREFLFAILTDALALFDEDLESCSGDDSDSKISK